MPTDTTATFFRKLALYLAPFAIAFTALTAGLIYLGESMPLGMVVSTQQTNDKVLYRYQYGNRDLQFKILSANTRRAEVLAVGSSRILQFRAGFFNRNPDAFYNAAAPAWRLERVAQLVYNLQPDAMPKILIVSLDHPWFNDAYEDDIFPADVSDFQNIFLVNRSFMQDLIAGKDFGRAGFDINQYWTRAEPGGSGGLALGLRAIRDGHGFRSDGSEQYGDFLIARWLGQDQQRDAHLRLMRRGEDMYVYGETVSETALAELDALLTYAAQHDITVVGYLPPYAPRLWQQMLERGNHTYLNALPARLQTLFDAHNFPFFDFSSGDFIDTRDDEFFDGWHASELGNLRLFLRMMEAQPDLFAPYVDADALYDIAANAASTWEVFGMGVTP